MISLEVSIWPKPEHVVKSRISTGKVPVTYILQLAKNDGMSASQKLPVFIISNTQGEPA